MSLIHWDKSVLSFHLKEIIEDHKAGDQTALLGIGAIFLGTVAVPVATKFGRPILKAIIKSWLSIYQETKTEIDYLNQSKNQTTQSSTLQSLNCLTNVNKNGRVINEGNSVE